MAPLTPRLQLKVDELFRRWLGDPHTQRALSHALRRIRDPGATSDPAAAATPNADPGNTTSDPNPVPRPLPRPALRTTGPRTVHAHRKEEPPPQSPPPGHSVPAFYFPCGRPPLLPQDTEDVIALVECAFEGLPRGRAGLGDMAVVAKACGCPLYWKAPLFYAAGGERTGSVSVHTFVAMWRKVLLTCHDDAARFVRLLGRPGCRGLIQEDFVPFLQDVVNSHPGLAFLRAAKEFHSRYITTVIQRIFYTVNRSWSGMISREELRRSSFLQAVSQLEAEPDINCMTSFFSYEHFYVIYCKFWELDLDRDLTIDKSDLARHGDGAISSRMIDRIFSGAVTRVRLPQKVGKLGYADFVWFLLSEEDKTTPTSTEYWFRCMDLDGDGALSMFELEFFYEEQAQRMAARGVEPLPFHDLARQVLDLVAPRCPGRITLRDLKQCGLAGEFFDAFFNVDKYLAREQREQAGSPQDTDYDPAASAWDRYAAEEYDFLVAEEAMAGDNDDDEGSDPVDLYGLADEDGDDLEPL